MAISPILVNGTIQQTHDVLQNHTKETHKAATDQMNIVHQEVKQDYQKATKVVHSDETRFQEERYDAKEKGHGQYHGDGGKQRQQKSHPDGKVILKPEGGFDMKI